MTTDKQIPFEYVDHILAANDLTNPNLKILIPGIDEYKVLAYQHRGDLEFSFEVGCESFVRNSDASNATLKFDEFFHVANLEQPDLLITPEYSCPWDCIQRLVNEQIFPTEQGLWMVGCESIVPSKFKSWIDSNNDCEGIVFLYEDEAYKDEEDISRFLDPILYIFKTKCIDSEKEVVVFLFQFKTIPMADAFHGELDKMIRGTRRFIIRNNVSSIWLISIICSEALDFPLGQDDLNFADKPYVILHPQLNPSPLSGKFSDYRKQIYQNSNLSSKDLYCLNWAAGSKIGDKEIDDSRSSIYVKSDGVASAQGAGAKSDRVCSNDELGIYYHYWSDARTAIYSLSYKEGIYAFNNCKASLGMVAPQYGTKARIGLRGYGLYGWIDGKWVKCVQACRASLNTYCANNYVPYIEEANLPGFQMDKFVSISIGLIESELWHQPISNKLLQMDSREISKRLPLYDDTSAKAEKESQLLRLKTLQDLFKDSDQIPADSFVADLKDNCNFDYTNSVPEFNVKGGGNHASLVYVGDMPLNRAASIFTTISDSLGRRETQSKKRLIVWYTQGTKFLPLYDKKPPKFTDNSARSGKSISKSGDL